MGGNVIIRGLIGSFIFCVTHPIPLHRSFLSYSFPFANFNGRRVHIIYLCVSRLKVYSEASKLPLRHA